VLPDIFSIRTMTVSYVETKKEIYKMKIELDK